MKKIMVVLVVLVLALSAGSAFATIAGSRHDMTNTTLTFGGTGDPCLHCHTPHGSSAAALWNRADTTVTQQTGTFSGVFRTTDLDPRGSQLCMGCHDGTLSTTLTNGPGRGNSAATYDTTNMFQAAGNSFALIGANAAALSNDHPLGVAVTASAGVMQVPGAGFPLYDGVGGTGGTHVECATCHDPHAGNLDNFNGFLRTGFACSVCHIK